MKNIIVNYSVESPKLKLLNSCGRRYATANTSGGNLLKWAAKAILSIQCLMMRVGGLC